jgi:hypothetical protein
LTCDIEIFAGQRAVTTNHLSKIADLNRKIEAARSAGDTFRLQRLITQQQRLLESDDRQSGK